jgi:hypothetical protein
MGEALTDPERVVFTQLTGRQHVLLGISRFPPSGSSQS